MPVFLKTKNKRLVFLRPRWVLLGLIGWGSVVIRLTRAYRALRGLVGPHWVRMYRHNTKDAKDIHAIIEHNGSC